MPHFDAILQEKALHHTGCCFPPKHSLSAADFSVTDLHNMCRRRFKGHGPEAEPQIFFGLQISNAHLDCSEPLPRSDYKSQNSTARAARDDESVAATATEIYTGSYHCFLSSL